MEEKKKEEENKEGRVSQYNDSDRFDYDEDADIPIRRKIRPSTQFGQVLQEHDRSLSAITAVIGKAGNCIYYIETEIETTQT